MAGRVQLLTTNLVLAEVHRLILFRAGIRAARSVVDRMETSSRLHVDHADAADHRNAIAWLDKLSDQKITYTDAVSFAVMEKLDCSSALSFDHDFEIAGFSVLRLA